jgi:hypothetical protein
MNKSQKILTLVFLALFVATLIWFPWIHHPGFYHEGQFVQSWDAPQDAYYCVLFLYSEGDDPNWFKVRFEWVCLAVFYVVLFFMLKNRKTIARSSLGC